MNGPIEPGLCSVTLRALGTEEVIDLAVATGLTAVEWGGDVHLPPGADAAAALAARCADAGLTCPSYGSYLQVSWEDEAAVARHLDTAAELGAANVRVWCPWGVVPTSPDDERAPVAPALRAIAEAAAERDLTVSVEFHPHTLTETAVSANRLLAEVDAPNLFTYWQPAVGLAVDELLAELVAVTPSLSHLHVFRWDAEGGRLALERGADLWPAAFDAVSEADETGRWTGQRYAFLEFVAGDDPDQLARDAATVRSWLGGP